jgi:predicted ArsR family transcriptional regulator
MNAAPENTATACYLILSILNDSRERTLGDIVSATGMSRGLAIRALNKLEADKAVHADVVSEIKVFSAVSPPRPKTVRPRVTHEQFMECLDDWTTVENISGVLGLAEKTIHQRLCRLKDRGVKLESKRKRPDGSVGGPKKMWRIKK